MKSVTVQHGTRFRLSPLLAAACISFAVTANVPNNYLPVDDRENFNTVKAKMIKSKPKIIADYEKVLKTRYDLSDKPIAGVTSNGRKKPVQGGVRVLLPKNTSWQQLADLTPAEIKQRDLWPAGFYPLPHEHHNEGGMLFPKFHIDAIKQQDNRDLTRFDLDYIIPDHFLPEFPPAIYLTTRPDLGDVSQGKLVSIDNYYDVFNGILNPKQLDGVRLLATPTMQQQFNATWDRRSERASLGVSCLDCHANGHSNGATHLLGDIRPQQLRPRLDTPSLRGVNIQRLFGSKRALKTVEDFTGFEQRAAYFDGDMVIATKKGVNILERGSEVHAMAEFQELLNFPPAPKLDIYGKLDPQLASEAELRGQQVFFGKGQCSICHTPPYYTDNLMHDLQTGRFVQDKMIAGRKANSDGPIKTFPLRGIKDSPPYLHDGRLLTLADTVEFFNLVLQTKLNEQEKQDLVAFMLTL